MEPPMRTTSVIPNDSGQIPSAIPAATLPLSPGSGGGNLSLPPPPHGYREMESPDLPPLPPLPPEADENHPLMSSLDVCSLPQATPISLPPMPYLGGTTLGGNLGGTTMDTPPDVIGVNRVHKDPLYTITSVSGNGGNAPPAAEAPPSEISV